MREVQVGVEDRFALESTLDGRTVFAGCFFLVAGAAPMLSETVAAWVADQMPAWLAPVTLLAGLAALAYRRGAIVDRAAQTVTRWWGVCGLPLYRQAQPLRARAVQISKITCVSGEGANTVKYPIALVAAGGRSVLAAGHSIATTWSLATRLAEFLGVELDDQTGKDVYTTNPLRN